MHFHLHASKAFSLTLTADIYFSAVGTAGGGRGAYGSWRAEMGGSKYTPPHRPAPPAPAPVEIARAESSAAQKQVWDTQQKLNSSPFPSAF